MKTWLIWVQDNDGYGTYTWLEAAWTDDQTAENHEGWLEEVERVKQMCAKEKSYSYRIQAVNIPGVHELFDIPEVTAVVA